MAVSHIIILGGWLFLFSVEFLVLNMIKLPQLTGNTPFNIEDLEPLEMKVFRKCPLANMYKKCPEREIKEVVKFYFRHVLKKYPLLNEPKHSTVSCMGTGGKKLYSGEIDSQRISNGLGTLLMGNGSVYEGYFYQGIRQGDGTLITNKGVIYEGQWHDKRLITAVTITYLPTGKTYTGQVSQFLPHGIGIET